MRTLSGSGSRGLMIETMKAQGADSFAGRLVSIIQGSSETTFYVLAVYFGSVGIRKERHALTCGLLADVAGLRRGRARLLPVLRLTGPASSGRSAAHRHVLGAGIPLSPARKQKPPPHGGTRQAPIRDVPPLRARRCPSAAS